MEKYTTSRGLARWNIPNRDYAGEPERTLSVQESSLASEFRVWVGYSDTQRMHLTVDAARDLRDALSEWLAEVQPTYGSDGEGI